ncbi:putative alpha-1,6-mannosyltransferase [Penicillium oxalicum 114-2]|uniref:Putative alpha-1,6-mannosyltransferase n=1 Tax=Penicillium oxalicum (strain 114-2 / CGMCC 5302) TaxID=933388 RepID=S7ZUE3_PENO1|nr:putative alpha-1,6-mannosyltransferase [Penicillium oxalicum 114-2]
MPRPPYYLTALILSSIIMLFWLSMHRSSSVALWSLSSGSCSCGEPAKNDAQIKPPHPASSPTQSKSSSTTTPTASSEETASLHEPEQSYYLPFRPSQQLARLPFPSKVWQKAGPSGISENRQEDIQSWFIQNPYLRHEVFTDSSAEHYVKEKFAKFPEIIDIYQDLQVPILKADFLRQLILYAEGGVWSDLDVTCHQPIDTWIPHKYQSQTNLVVGIEFDGNQFASWTVMAKPRTGHIAAVIDYIMEKLEETAVAANTTIAGLKMKDIVDVVAVTGPQAMTQAIFRSLSVEMNQTISGENVSHLHEPVLLHDVLVLPNAAFAALQGDWPKDQGPYLVEHHYAGSWKNSNGGEKSSSSVESSQGEKIEADNSWHEAGSEDTVKTEVRDSS